ncbi:MAG: hypothetical protein AAFN70_10980, partial [Planctomycetota bacterium]
IAGLPANRSPCGPKLPHHVDGNRSNDTFFSNILTNTEFSEYWQLGTKKSGKGRRKVGRKKRRMRAKIRHRKK